MANGMRNTCPPFKDFFFPLLVVVKDEAIRLKDATEQVAVRLNLSDEAKQERTSGGNAFCWRDRTAWAKSHMLRKGLVESPRRGYVVATNAGKEFLRRHSNGFTMSDVNAIPDATVAEDQVVTQTTGEVNSDNSPPDELIYQAAKEMNATLKAEMLDRIKNAPPDFLEKLVVELLEAMGYGTPEQRGGPGDGGIDGVIYQDELKLEKIYIQAKRYKEGHSIPPNLIRQFAGAKPNGSKGVFITTSSFTKKAKDEANKESNNIVIIDGDRLAELMVRHGIGCTTSDTIHIKKIDEDYFPPDDE